MIGSDERPAPGDADSYRDGLRRLYADLDQAVASRGPICQLSGRCCRFAEYGHTLFLSAPEAAVLLADAPRPSRPLDQGETCPWQDARGHCTAREARPLGCRVYYCDPAYQSDASELSEAFIGRLKAMVESNGWPWGYAPLHHHLQAAQKSGQLPSPAASAEGPPGGTEGTDSTILT